MLLARTSLAPRVSEGLKVKGRGMSSGLDSRGGAEACAFVQGKESQGRLAGGAGAEIQRDRKKSRAFLPRARRGGKGGFSVFSFPFSAGKKGAGAPVYGWTVGRLDGLRRRRVRL